MKNIFVAFLIASLHFCCPGVYAQVEGKKAQFNYVEGADYDTNLILNPSAETDTNFVSASGGTLARDTSAGNKINGKASFKWTGTALGQTVVIDTASSYPDDLTEGDCEFRGRYKTGSNSYSAQILDASSAVLNTVALPSVAKLTNFSVGYPCGPKGTRFPVFKQTVAGTPTAINFGKLVYGASKNIGTYTPPSEFGAVVSGSGVISLVTPVGSNILPGSAAVSDTSLFTMALTGLTSTPKCTVGVNSGTSTVTPSAFISLVTPSSISVRTGTVPVGANPSLTKAAVDFTLSCTKTGSDAPLTIVATQNQDSTDRIFFTPTVSGLGAGSGTFTPDWTYYTTNGINANVCYRFAKDTTAGTGATEVSFSLPPGVTVNPVTRALGTAFSQITGTPVNLLLESGVVKIIVNSGNVATGASFTANSVTIGCITFPTTSKKPTNGAVIVNTVSTNTGSSRVYFSGSYSAAGGLGNNCTTNPCTMPTNDGVVNVGRGGTGLYSINITAGQCADSLSCNIEASTPQKMAGGAGIGNTTYSFQTLNASNVSTDSWGTFNCSCKK